MSEQWFEVVDRGVIVFAGPLQACCDYAAKHDHDNYMTIRPVTF